MGIVLSFQMAPRNLSFESFCHVPSTVLVKWQVLSTCKIFLLFFPFYLSSPRLSWSLNHPVEL